MDEFNNIIENERLLKIAIFTAAKQSMKERIIILGGGIAGLTAAIALRQLGYEPVVYESARELKGIGAGFGLASNAMKAFELLGLESEVAQLGYPVDSFRICDELGRALIETDPARLQARYQAENYAFHRADLHKLLMAYLPSEALVLSHRAVSFKQDDDGVDLSFANGENLRGDYLLVADGVHSAIRQQLVPSARPRYAGYTCWRAVVDNRLVGVEEGVETWGAKGRFGLTPLIGDRLYWYACVNAPARDAHYAAYRVADLQAHFSHYHEPVVRALSITKDEDLLWNDIMDIRPLRRFAYGRALLLGDAAHATTPNMGQGACQAIEDAAILKSELRKRATFEEAFIAFEGRRLKRTQYIIETSRRAGWLAQLSNPILVSVRNNLFRLLPNSLAASQLKRLYEEDFIEDY
ncbi:FAD-dependent monooxygenase [Olivibacter sitiensis]|uniref:FAD-dependent monooxygenase n=1 Tax=Olivibacter sitiensis TaxID=376470 RepID=UPI001FDF3146|nr:FAD-dependent monooxygenase [Olivibacter sitiensis]